MNVLVFLALTAFASPRSAEQAQDIAKDFFSQRSGTSQQKRVAPKQNKMLELSYTALIKTNAAPAYYGYNRGEGEGWVMVSGDTDVPEVLAYSNEGTFDYERLGENAKYMLSRYASQVERVQEGEKLLYATNTSYEPINSLLGNRQWGQDAPFNTLCPYGCVVGCVATAMAQIMAHHNHPVQGKGTISYTSKSNGYSLSRDFSESTYDWTNMSNYYGVEDDGTSTAAQAVAVLSRDCGYSVKMDYGESSGAYSSDVPGALVDYFSYDKSMRKLELAYFSTNAFLDSIYAELSQGRPLYMSASTTANEGHAYVVDGMDAYGYLRINWGWYGSGDGFYLLTNMHPVNQGTGGSILDLPFTEYITVITGIKADAGGDYIASLATSQVFPIDDNDAKNTLKIKNDGKTEIYLKIDELRNKGIVTYIGSLGYTLLDKNGDVVVAQKGSRYADIEGLPLTSYYPTYYLGIIFPSDFPAGVYSLKATFSNTEGSAYTPILSTGETNLTTVINTGDQIFVYAQDDNKYAEKYAPYGMTVVANSSRTNLTLSWKQRSKPSKSSYIVFVWNEDGMKYYTTSSKTLTIPSPNAEATYSWAVASVSSEDKLHYAISIGDDFSPSTIATDVENIEEKGIDVQVLGNTIVVNTPQNTTISLYDVEGKLLQQKHHMCNATFHVVKGVYIVTTSEKKQKVLVK